MNKSEDITELTKALVNFQGLITPVTKGAVNPFFNSKYADLDTIIEHCKEALEANELAITQTSVMGEVGAVTLETTLCHVSGQWISGVMVMKPTKATPQEYGSTLTYARRYGYSSILGLCTEEDDDGNAGSKTPKNTPEKPQGGSQGTKKDKVDTFKDKMGKAFAEFSRLKQDKDYFKCLGVMGYETSDEVPKDKQEEVLQALRDKIKEIKEK